MKKKLISFLIFGCLGTTVEVYFTAITELLDFVASGNPDMRLMGWSYIWMLPIYGSTAFLFPPIYQLISKFNIVIRLLIYGAGILVVEFISGYIIDQLTGSCPWAYQAPLAIMTYIRLDYYPLWAGFGLIIETVHRFIEKRISF